MTIETPDIDRRVVQDIKTRAFFGLLFYTPLFLVIVGANDFYKRHSSFCVLFGTLIAGICLFRLFYRLVLSERVKRHSQSLDNAIFYISAGATGLIWGSFFAWFMVLPGEYTSKMLMIVCTAGICAGGTVGFAPSFALAVFFELAVLIPAAALMLLYRTHEPLAVLVLIYSVYLVFIAGQGNREYRQALKNELLLVKKTEELGLLARIDSLTGLYNRRYFDENIDRECKKCSRVRTVPVVIIGDIDHFKKINDQYGHLAGDEFLKLTAEVFRSVFRRDTDIVARFGGEEFIALLTDTPAQAAFELAEELRRRMSAMRMSCNGSEISATISIGIACSRPDIDESRDTLISRADNALYQAKKRGRNQTVSASCDEAAGRQYR